MTGVHRGMMGSDTPALNPQMWKSNPEVQNFSRLRWKERIANWMLGGLGANGSNIKHSDSTVAPQRLHSGTTAVWLRHGQQPRRRRRWSCKNTELPSNASASASERPLDLSPGFASSPQHLAVSSKSPGWVGEVGGGGSGAGGGAWGGGDLTMVTL